MLNDDDDEPGETHTVADVTETVASATIKAPFGEFDRFEYDADLEGHRTRFDPSRISPTMAVISALEAISKKSPMEMSPLSSVLDSDALGTLLQQRDDRTGHVQIHFSFEGYDVDVSSDGQLFIQPTTTTERSSSPTRK